MTTELTDDQREIESYLIERVRDGKRYFKAKYIADELDMTAKSVGVNLSHLQDRTDRISLEIFSGRSSGSTWLVELDGADDSDAGPQEHPAAAGD